MATIKLDDLWTPSDKQRECMQYIGKGKKIFFGGARGGGKSELGLWSAAFACMMHQGLNAAIFRSTLPELERDMILRFLDNMPERLYTWNERKKTATFFNGSRLFFVALENVKDARKFKGAQYAYIVIDEANEFEVEIIQRIRGSLRSTTTPKFRPTLLMTGNPGGVSDEWFKKHFIKPQYEYWSEEELEEKDDYVFVQAMVDDNPNADYVVQYKKELKSLPDDLRAAWLYGSWDSFSGQFFNEWHDPMHVVEPFTIPDHWMRICGLDLGYGKHPTVMLWMAQNPETSEVYVYREYAEIGVTEEHIENIKLMQPDGEEMKIFAIYADPAMWIERKDLYSSESPAHMFTKAGMYLQPSNNSRVPGWQVVKQWLHWQEGKPPKLRFFSTCAHCIDTLPSLRYSTASRTKQGMDLDTKMADDAADALRYALVAGFGYPVEAPPRKVRVYDKIRKDDDVRYAGTRSNVPLLDRYTVRLGTRKNPFDNNIIRQR